MENILSGINYGIIFNKSLALKAKDYPDQSSFNGLELLLEYSHHSDDSMRSRNEYFNSIILNLSQEEILQYSLFSSILIDSSS